MNTMSNCVPRSGTAPSIASPTTNELLTGDWRTMPKILFVDDEWEVVQGLRRAFLQYPYQVAATTSPELALQMFRDEAFDVIVADELMPGMRGSELLTRIAREFPAARRILLTGHATPETAARAVNDAGVARFLLKPCPVEKLHEAIETALRTTPFASRLRRNRRRAFLVDGRAGPAETSWYANELVLQAQRVVSLERQTPVGYEISVRIQAHSGNIHTIGNFISSTGHQVPSVSIDRWVFRHVVEALRAHVRTFALRNLTVSLNVSLSSLSDPEFIRLVASELPAEGLAPHFAIELRESVLAKSLREDKRLLAGLCEMTRSGTCRLCVDGVSGALWQKAPFNTLPVSMAKIDSRHGCDVLTNRQSEAIVRTAVEWGSRNDARIVATGIDSIAIAERLHALGIRYGQGSALGGVEPLASTLAELYY
ncbi:MAG TPA: EAL domain-containing protein [Steroidobacteraceae bacterium]|nr:EAL domain-containing protein [Steroidobacteraceae bacterium]